MSRSPSPSQPPENGHALPSGCVVRAASATPANQTAGGAENGPRHPRPQRSYWSSSQWPNERRDIYEDLYAHWDQTPDKDKNCEFYNKNCSWNSVASFYINKNSERSSYRQLKVHTVSIDLESDWMEKLSQETGVSHNQVKSEN